MINIDKQTILGALKATGSKDPDVLHAAKTRLTEKTRGLRAYSWIPLIVGTLLTLTVIGAFIGIPFLAAGIFLRVKTGKSLRLADSTYDEYVASLGARAVPAGEAMMA